MPHSGVTGTPGGAWLPCPAALLMLSSTLHELFSAEAGLSLGEEVIVIALLAQIQQL